MIAAARLVRPSLVAAHGAVAMLALAAMHVSLPAAPLPQLHAAGQPAHLVAQAPRRLPATRRAERVAID